MNTIQSTFRPTLISAALMMAFGPALGQDASVDELAKPDSSVSVGIGNWSGDRPQQGIYEAMRDKGSYGLFDADIVKRDDETGTWLKLKATNLGLDNRELRGEYSRQGNVGGFFEYGRTTRDNPYTINTGLQGIGTTNLTAGSSAGSFARREVDLGITRELLRLGGFKSLAPGLELKVDFQNETKTGTRQTGWGSAAMFSVEPLNSTTRQLETILQYTGEKLQLSGGYYGSWYDNKDPLILEQVNGAAAGSVGTPGLTPLSQPMSNQAHQFFLDGGYKFTPTTRATFKAAFTRATQDEHLPTYDLGGVNAPFAGAPSHLDGQVNTTLLQLGLSSRPLPKLSITGNLRYYDVNDKTPLRQFVSVATAPFVVFNTPQSFTTMSGKLEATYRLPMNYSVTGGVDYSDQDRSYPTVGTLFVPFRANVKETTYRVQAKRALTESVNGSIAYLHSKRNGSQYVLSGATEENQINPMHIADRDRDKVRAAFDWDPSEALSLQFRIDHSQDKYPEKGRPYGLRDGGGQTYALDASYLFSENWKLAAWYSYDVIKARSLSRTSATSAKDTTFKDVGDSLGVNLRGRLSARIEAGFGLDWSRSASSSPQTLTDTGVTLNPLGDVKNRLLRIKFDGKYTVDKASEVRFDLIHERWSTNDPTWNFVNGSPFAYTTSGATTIGGVTVVDGTTLTQNQKQSSTFVGVRYIYRFQ